MDTENTVSRSATLFVVSIVQFLVPFMLTSVVVALPTIGIEFSASAKYLSLIEMVYMLALALFLLPIVRLADINGHRKMFITGIFVMLISTIVLPLSKNIELLIILRFVQGIGGAMITATSLTILSFVFPKKERGGAFGITISSVFLGLTAGPTLSGTLISYVGWRFLFVLAIPVEFVAVVIALAKLKSEWIIEEGGQFDWCGTFIYVLSLMTLIIGTTQLNESSAAKWLSIIGVVGLGCFFFYEKKRTSPLFNVNLILANLPFTSNSVATGINYATSFGLMFFFESLSSDNQGAFT